MHDGSKMASQLPAPGLVDEFGFPLGASEISPSIKNEDITLIRGFLGQIKDTTLSRGVKRALEDLLERLPK